MILSSTETLSLWDDQVHPFPQERLTDNLRTDVCIVGAGIAGLTTAYLLLKEGRSVVVLESHRVGSGQTGRTTAHLTTCLDERYFNLEKLHGAEGARLAAESHQSAIEKMEQIVRIEKIQCDWRRLPGYLCLAPEDDPSILHKEFEALQRVGLDGITWAGRSPMSSFDTGKCIHFGQQATFHPMKYLAGLCHAIRKMGGRIYTETPVDKIESGQPALITARNHCLVMAEVLVVATNTPVNDMIVIHSKQAAYRTYVVGAEIPKGSVAQALYWDTGDPCHYARVESGSLDKDHLIVGGEDHKTGQEKHPEKCFDRLELWARKYFPMIRSIDYRWSGQVMQPMDGLAYIGKNPMDSNNVFVITGDAGNGMTHCTLGAMLVKDLIIGRENPWEKLYSPGRISLLASREFIKENMNVAAQYMDWVAPGETMDAEDLKRGEGAIFRKGMSLIATYKDIDDQLHHCSATCPHMGGVVHWNSAEKTWDCPCHGSRFSAHGHVISGPAISDLKEISSVEEPPAESTIAFVEFWSTTNMT